MRKSRLGAIRRGGNATGRGGGIGRFGLFALLVGILSGTALAQQADRRPRPQVPPPAEAYPPALEKSPLLAEAERLGLLAGAAEYCRIEPDRLDDFIARAHARLATMARKDPLAVAGARVEFNAFAALGRAEGPQEGCAAFHEVFRAAHRALQ